MDPNTPPDDTYLLNPPHTIIDVVCGHNTIVAISGVNTVTAIVVHARACRIVFLHVHANITVSHCFTDTGRVLSQGSRLLAPSCIGL